MDSDLSSSMYLMRMLPIGAVVMSVAITVMMFGPLVLYVIARWRANRMPVPDDQLGLKFALHWFATSALHLSLMGGVLLVYTMISPGESAGKGAFYRMAFAMLVPAGAILGLHLMLLKRTNDDEVPGVRRLFLGYNVIVTGLVGFSALVAGFQILFAKGSSGGIGHIFGALVLVYGTAWALLGWRLGQLVLGFGGGMSGLGGGGTGLPDVVPPAYPQQQQSPGSAAGGGGLPSLGGGSFPPIDPNK